MAKEDTSPPVKAVTPHRSSSTMNAPAITPWASHSTGDKKQNRKSRGSVTEARDAVSSSGVSMAAVRRRFSGRAQKMKAPTMPKYPKVLVKPMYIHRMPSLKGRPRLYSPIMTA